MTWKIETEDEHTLVVESRSGVFRVELTSESRWVANVRVIECRDGLYRVQAAGPLHGVKEPFAVASERLRSALDLSTEDDLDAVRAYLREHVYGNDLRGSLHVDRMHYGHVIAFLQKEADTGGPEELGSVIGRYQMLFNEFRSDLHVCHSVDSVDFEGDWVYSIATDLVRRQCEPSDSLCVLVASEPLDVNFDMGFLAFREHLDRISGDYVHFFALSGAGGVPSKSGKQLLVAALQESNISISAEQAFLVFIQLRNASEEGFFEADVLGVHEFPRDIKQDEVSVQITELAKTARKVKTEGGFHSDFVHKSKRQLGWIEAKRTGTRLGALLRMLERAMTFILP